MAKNSKSSNGTVVRRVKAGGASSNSSAARTDDKTIRKVSASTESSKKVKSGKKSTTKTSTPKAKAKRSSGKKPFILFRPIFAFGRYFRDSWYELRQVKWTNRRATWMLTLAVILFSMFFAFFILIFDNAFQWIVQEVIL